MMVLITPCVVIYNKNKMNNVFKKLIDLDVLYFVLSVIIMLRYTYITSFQDMTPNEKMS